MDQKVERISDNLALNIALDTIKRNKQALVFAGTKPSAEKLAEDLAGNIKTEHAELKALAEKAENILGSPTKQCKRLGKCLAKGVAFHHAGLTHKQRDLIERKFKSGAVQIICCTPTLAMGLSIPAYRTIIKDLKRYTHSGMQYIPVLEYLQMAGRAGRPEFDKEGQSIILASTESEKEKLIEKYIKGEPEEIQSKVAVEPVLRTYLLSLIAADFISTKHHIMHFFSKTFWAYQYADMDALQEKIERMLQQLIDWEFLKSTEDDFTSANDLENITFEATRIGQRVAELYLDPQTAHDLIQAMQKGATKTLIDSALLHMIASTLEMRPLLRVRTKEMDIINEELAKVDSNLLVKEPNLYDPEYDDFLNAFKTALFFKSWIEENQEPFLLETFNIRPGEIRAKLDIADWLIYTTTELANLLQFRDIHKAMLKLRMRLKHGVKEELLPLLKLKDIGRVRGRKLFRNGIKTIADVKKADAMKLSQILGKAVANSIKKQVGQEIKIVTKTRGKGQMALATE